MPRALPTAPLPTESVRPETSPGGEKTIDVTLPSKNGLYEVTVYVDGALQYGPTSVSITDGTAVMLQIPVRGKGTLPVDVYLDGAIYDSQLISFG